MFSLLQIKIARLKMVSLQSIIWVFLLNNFSRVINLLLTKLARDRTGRILALGLSCTDLAALGPCCQDLGPIFSQYGPRAWLIRYIYRQIEINSQESTEHTLCEKFKVALNSLVWFFKTFLNVASHHANWKLDYK